MGITGDLGNARIAAAYETVIAACRKHGKFPGMAGSTTKILMRRYVALGMRMILSGNDLSMLDAGRNPARRLPAHLQIVRSLWGCPAGRRAFEGRAVPARGVAAAS